MTSIDALSSILQDYKVTSDKKSSTVPTTSDVSSYSSRGPAYLLDISQAAQDILNSQGGSNPFSQVSLTDTQKQKIESILAKYQDSPVTDETLQALDADLHAAGVAPDQLASIQKAKDFNPVALFLQILGGNDSNNSSLDISSIFGASNNGSGLDLSSILNASSNNSDLSSILGASDDSKSSPQDINNLLQQYLANLQSPEQLG